jgi:hypothetical protein
MSGIIQSVLQEDRLFPPSPEFVRQANISGMAAYEALCAEAEKDMPGFWARLAREQLLWHKPFTQILDESNAPFYRWFHDGQLNASYNCLDRHLKTQPDKTAIIFEADDGKVTKINYRELYQRVCRFANALKAKGIAQKPASNLAYAKAIQGLADSSHHFVIRFNAKNNGVDHYQNDQEILNKTQRHKALYVSTPTR